jgi:hypothetical protein
VTNYQQWLADYLRPTRVATADVVGERMRSRHAAPSHSDNRRAGISVATADAQISILLDEHPADFGCTTFYAKELEREAAS